MVASATSIASQSVQPNPNEDYRSFVYRAHYALMDSIPNPSRRNAIVWNAWDSVCGNPARERAIEHFPADKYRHVPDQPYFYEHSTTGRDGSRHDYDFNLLDAMAQQQAQREDTQCYSAIASHHTSDGLKGPNQEPWTVGYAGVYRLGMVGDQNPKWAIFADEFHRKDQAKLLDDRRRRSVEVLRFKDGRTPILDPIATLGVDSPRLNLPVARYEAEVDFVERYSFVAPASVGAMSSYVPNVSKRDGEKYELPDASTTQPSNQSDSQMSLTPADLEAIKQSFRSIPELAWAREQMTQAQQGDGSDLGMTAGSTTAPDADGQQQPPAFPSVTPPQSQPNQSQYGASPQLPPKNPMMGTSPLMRPNTTPYSGDDEVDKERYDALRAENASLAEKYSEMETRNQRLAETNQQMMTRLAQQGEAIANLEKQACDGDRSRVIHEMCEQYSETGVFDRAELIETCLYTNGSELTNQEFYSRMELLENTAKRVAQNSPINRPLIPEGMTPEQVSENERYSMVMEKHTELVRTGKHQGMTFPAIEDMLISEGKLTPAKRK